MTDSTSPVWTVENKEIFRKTLKTNKDFYLISKAIGMSVSECLKYYYSQYKTDPNYRMNTKELNTLTTPAPQPSNRGRKRVLTSASQRKGGATKRRQKAIASIGEMSDPYQCLYQTEKDLAWLGEESRRISGKKAFDLNFVEKYSMKVSPSLYKQILDKKDSPSYQINPIPRLMRYHDLVVREVFMKYRQEVAEKLKRGECPEGWDKAFDHWNV